MRSILSWFQVFISLYQRYVAARRLLDERADQLERDEAAAIDTCMACDARIAGPNATCSGCGYDPERSVQVHGDLQVITWLYWDVMEVLRSVDPELEEMEDFRDELIEQQFQLRRRLELMEARDLGERWDVEAAHREEDREWEREQRRKGLPVDGSRVRRLELDGLEETGEVAYPVLQQHRALFVGTDATLEEVLAVARRDVPLDDYAESCALVVRVANTLPIVRRSMAESVG